MLVFRKILRTYLMDDPFMYCFTIPKIGKLITFSLISILQISRMWAWKTYANVFLEKIP